jgi:hypothetical protein
VSELFRGPFRGQLLESPEGEITREHLSRVPGMSFVGTVPASRWEQYVLRSSVPLRGEDKGAEYEYGIICRRSGPRLLLATAARPVTSHIIENELPNVFATRLRPVTINVDGLVRSLIEKPALYSITFVHTKLPGFGAALRSASLYGQDIGEATFVRENLGLMRFATCGLRHASASAEIVRLGTEGTIFFHLGATSVAEVEDAMRYLRKTRHLEPAAWQE